MFGLNKNATIKTEKDQAKMLEKLSTKMDNMRVAEYVEVLSNPVKLIWMNFILGLARGLGMGIGLTILLGLFLYILQSWVDLPFIGKLIADLLEIVEKSR
ncbi:MAG: hypothetical protein COA82_04365 [Alkaliphilus sp.]|nr:MAG: hypothetical protein COA82_04365 [Alkaliphilus sp.]